MSEQSAGRLGAVLSGIMTFLVSAFAFCTTFTIAGTQTALAAAYILWIPASFKSAKWAVRRSPLDIPLLLFVGASLLSVLLSGRLGEGFWNLRNYLLMGVIYLIVSSCGDTPSQRRLFAILALSAMLSALYGILIFAMGKGEGTLGRTAGSFSNAMTFGGVMMLLSAPLFALATARGIGGRLRAFSAAGAALTLAALFFSFTRSSWIGSVAAICIILLLQRRRIVPLFIALLLLFVVILPSQYRERFFSIFDPGYRTNAQRLEMLEGGFRIFLKSPIVGVGPIDLKELYELHKPPGAGFTFGHLHNNVLNVAVTLGIVGLAAFVYLFVSILRLMACNLTLDLPPPQRAWVIGSIGAVAGFLANGMFEWNFADAEVVTLLYVIVGSNCAISALFGRLRPPGRGTDASGRAADAAGGG